MTGKSANAGIRLIALAMAVMITVSVAIPVQAAGIVPENWKCVFDAEYYAARYPDLKAVFGTNEAALFNHFKTAGMSEGRRASAEFDVRYYMDAYADLRGIFGADLVQYYYHYINFGKAEGRRGAGDSGSAANASSSASTAQTVSAGGEGAFSSVQLTPAVNNATSSNAYSRCASPMQVSLYVNSSGGYTKTQYVSSAGIIKVENYDNSFQLLSTKDVPMELSIYGGAYNDGTYNYLAFGQNNLSDNSSVEVYRIVKYDAAWNRLGSVSLYGANTHEPFRAGCCRMSAANGYLFVRTCHTMYASARDGLNHQANVTMVIGIQNMSMIDAYYKVESSCAGYCSHSFNQFIQAEPDGKVYALDHGDAYPRAAMLTRFDNTLSYAAHGETKIVSYYGNTGDNTTNATIGGLGIGSTCILTAGSTAPSDGSSTVQDIYVSVTSKDFANGQGSTVRFITSHRAAADGWRVECPQLVKINNDRFLLLWNEKSGTTTRLCYIFLNGKGEPTSYTYTQDGVILSSCQAIYNRAADKVVWYWSQGGTAYFYGIKAN